MSVVVGWVDDLVAGVPIANTVWDGVKDVADAAWQEVAAPVIEFVFSLLGIEDETIVTVDVVSQRIMTDERTPNPAILAALRLQKNDEPVLSNLVYQYQQIKAKYAAYNSYSDTYIDGRPDASIRIRSTDNNAIKAVLDGINGHANTVLTAEMKVPDKFEWCKYKLQGSHGYTPYNNALVSGGYTYRVIDVVYNYTTDQYEVALATYEDVTVNTYNRVVVVIENIDATTDRKTTTNYTRVETIKSVTGITDVSTQVGDPVIEVVPKDSVTASDTSTLVSSVDSLAIWNTMYVNIVAHAAVQQYVVTYQWISGEWYYWVYDPAAGTYPTLANGNMRFSGLEMLPIVAIVQDKYMIDSDKTSVRYKQSKEILDKIGVNVDTMLEGVRTNVDSGDITDCFISFGINPHDTGAVISKALYTMCDVVYAEAGSTSEVIDGEQVYTFSIKEGRFNQVAKWDTQSRIVVNGAIGKIGTHTHSVSGNELIVRKQELDESYVEYRFGGITSMTYINHNNANSSLSTLDIDNNEVNGNGIAKKMYFNVPLSMFFVQQLTPAEQRELFTKTLRITYYAHNVTELEYYETEAFGNFLQFVAVVIMILSLGTGSWISFAIMMAASYILKRVLESDSAPDWLKAVAAIAYVYVAVTVGGGDDFGMQMLTGVTAATTVVSVHAQASIQDSQRDINATMAKQKQFDTQYGSRMDELKAKQDKWNTAVSTKEIAAMQYGVYNPPMPWDVFREQALGQTAYNISEMYNMPYNTVGNYHTKMKLLGVPLQK